MKTVPKITAIAVSAITLLALSTTVFAADTTPNTSVTGPTGSTGESATSGPEAQRVSEILAKVAAKNGAERLTDAKYTSTIRSIGSRVAAPGLPAGGEEALRKVYTVVARGSFVGYQAHVPPGAEFPTGNWLTMNIDVISGDVLDWSILKESPEAALARIDSPSALSVSGP